MPLCSEARVQSGRWTGPALTGVPREDQSLTPKRGGGSIRDGLSEVVDARWRDRRATVKEERMGYEMSPAKKKRDAAMRRRQEERWASKSGPVVVRSLGSVAPSAPVSRGAADLRKQA